MAVFPTARMVMHSSCTNDKANKAPSFFDAETRTHFTKTGSTHTRTFTFAQTGSRRDTRIKHQNVFQKAGGNSSHLDKGRLPVAKGHAVWVAKAQGTAGLHGRHPNQLIHRVSAPANIG